MARNSPKKCLSWKGNPRCSWKWLIRRKTLAANDFHLCQIEALKAEKVEAASAIIAACQASKDANTRREAAIQDAEEKRLAFLAAVVARKRLAVNANEAQLEYNSRIREQPPM